MATTVDLVLTTKCYKLATKIMPKLKSQKEKDLKELTEKLKASKAVVFSDYRGTTVLDLDKFRKTLRKENVFSKVYKLTLVKRAMKDAGLQGEIADYKTPVILSISTEDETAPARIIQNLTKDIKSIGILEGLLGSELMSKAQVVALGSLPTKDQLRSQFMSVLNGPISAFARVLNARAEKMGEVAAPAAPVAA